MFDRHCDFCSTLYPAEPKYINRNQGRFCSRSCAGKERANSRSLLRVPNSICGYCGKDFWRAPAKANRTVMVFCSTVHQSLAARKDSGIDFSTGPSPTVANYYRCNRCAKKFKSKVDTCRQCRIAQNIEQWLSGDNSVSWSGKIRDPRPFVKRHLLAIRGDRCEKCGFNQHGPHGSIIQMDHVDGNYLNNSLDNLQLLCPNCHAMTSTYGSRNKGSGRAHRRKNYEH